MYHFCSKPLVLMVLMSILAKYSIAFFYPLRPEIRKISNLNAKDRQFEPDFAISNDTRRQTYLVNWREKYAIKVRQNIPTFNRFFNIRIPCGINTCGADTTCTKNLLIPFHKECRCLTGFVPHRTIKKTCIRPCDFRPCSSNTFCIDHADATRSCICLPNYFPVVPGLPEVAGCTRRPCLRRNPCGPNTFCTENNLFEKTCVCLSGYEVASGTNIVTQGCVLTGECTEDTNCVGNTNGEVCDTDSNECVECTEDTNCVGNTNGEVCDTDSNGCVECIADSDCGDLVCNMETNMCECTEDTNCVGNTNGEVCNTDSNECVECTADANCNGNTNGEVCNTDSNECVECIADSDCPAAELTCNMDTNSCEIAGRR